MLKKQSYITPELEFFEMKPEIQFLYSTGAGNVETMNTVNGSWDEEDE